MKKIGIVSVFLLILFGLIIRNFHYSPVLFYEWDEGMYAQIAIEILKNKSLFTTFNGQIWLDKPPLVHLLIAMIFLIFGRSEFWARMLMVLISFLILVLMYFLARKISLNFSKKNDSNQIIISSILPVLVIAASPPFLERATLLNSDIFIAVSWLGYFLFWDKYWFKLFFLTLGVWGKSVLGFYPLLLDLLRPRSITLNRKKLQRGLLLILIPSLWYLAGFLKFGRSFIDHHFLSQVFKRIYVPIELHFGDKFFYFAYLWKNLNFINFLFIIALILIAIDFVNVFKNRKLKIFQSAIWSPILIIFSFLPFLTLLTVMRTKITWYVIIFLPFLALLLSYLYLKLKSQVLRLGIIVTVLIYFFLNFVSQTYFLKISYSPPDKLRLAKCLTKVNTEKVAFLVDEDERKIRNFLEAAHYDTTSSFYYGGSPSFVYYVQKKVDYYYDVDNFVKNFDQYSAAVLSAKDMSSNKNLLSTVEDKKINCRYGDWLSFVKKS